MQNFMITIVSKFLDVNGTIALRNVCNQNTRYVKSKEIKRKYGQRIFKYMKRIHKDMNKPAALYLDIEELIDRRHWYIAKMIRTLMKLESRPYIKSYRTKCNCDTCRVFNSVYLFHCARQVYPHMSFHESFYAGIMVRLYA